MPFSFGPNGALQYQDLFTQPAPRAGDAFIEVALNIDRPEEKIVMPGNPAVGTVILLPCVYSNDSFHKDEARLLGDHQGLLLSILAKNNIRHVCVEQFTQNAIAGSPEREHMLDDLFKDAAIKLDGIDYAAKDFRAELRRISDDESLMDVHRSITGAIGAAVMHAIMNSDVSLWASLSPEQERELNRATLQVTRGSGMRPLNESERVAMFDTRQDWAVSHAHAIFKQFPGATIAMPFGHQHEFLPQRFAGTVEAERPVWRSIQFPDYGLSSKG